ncbi:metal-dependent transcriptional regulator [Paludibaculum fermentans]|uniref:metal-dependent transcriptional regulator n=1 Tax=Paludibaculum fermentans TaxID=1473598 RepID=UPI003EB7A6F1
MAKKSTTRANSESTDDYLKAILTIGGPQEDRVTGNALAEHLQVRPASITGMLQKLAGQETPLVEYEKHRGARLTAAGKRRALEVIRHHRLIELFLHDILDYPWDEVHAEAERLEHFISERMEERIAAKLGDPLIDPHGHGIPRKDGSLPERREICLAELPAGNTGVVTSVSDRRPDVLRELKNLGIVPRTRLTVTERRTGSRPMRVRVGPAAQDIALTGRLSSAVYISQ